MIGRIKTNTDVSSVHFVRLTLRCGHNSYILAKLCVKKEPFTNVVMKHSSHRSHFQTKQCFCWL